MSTGGHDAEVAELRAQLEHQDRQKKLLRQKYRELKADMINLQKRAGAGATASEDGNGNGNSNGNGNGGASVAVGGGAGNNNSNNNGASGSGGDSQKLLEQIADLAARVKQEQAARQRSAVRGTDGEGREDVLLLVVPCVPSRLVPIVRCFRDTLRECVLRCAASATVCLCLQQQFRRKMCSCSKWSAA